LEKGFGTVFTVGMPVLWVDMDALRVVHCLNYFRYVETAAEELYCSGTFTFKELNENHKIAIP
jgi:acyl-CoA thioesterase FadM